MRKLFIILAILFCSSLSAKDLSFKVDGGTFDLEIYVFISKDTSSIRTQIENLGLDLSESDFDAQGVTFYEYGYPIAVWFPDTPKDLSILNHELMHITSFLLGWAGLTLNSETEEVYASELEYITRQFNKHLKFY